MLNCSLRGYIVIIINVRPIMWVFVTYLKGAYFGNDANGSVWDGWVYLLSGVVIKCMLLWGGSCWYSYLISPGYLTQTINLPFTSGLHAAFFFPFLLQRFFLPALFLRFFLFYPFLIFFQHPTPHQVLCQRLLNYRWI